MRKFATALLALILVAAFTGSPSYGSTGIFSFLSTKSKLKNDLTVTGVINNVGAKARLLNETFVNGSVTNGATYTFIINPGHAGTVSKISICAATVPVGGTNTVAITKGSNGNTMLSAATFDPTTIAAANTSQALALTSTTADLALTATDVIKCVYVAGTQGTPGVAPTLTVEYLPTDF